MNSFVECSIAMQNFLMILLDLPDFGTYSLSVKNHLFFREKESDNSNDCFCSFFCSYGFFDE